LLDFLCEQYGCNLIISIFYCRIWDLTGNTHGNLLLGTSGFKHCTREELCDLYSLPNSFGLPLGFPCTIIFDSYMLMSTALDQN